MLARRLYGKTAHPARNLSYGERRRLEIAGLWPAPSLPLDEWVAGMRRGGSRWRTWCPPGGGTTILLIEHNMACHEPLSLIIMLNFAGSSSRTALECAVTRRWSRATGSGDSA
jgi:ABC-type branched-subunit amino acid transport system ATPase component